MKIHKKPNIPLNKKIIGTIKRHPDGYGFFIADEENIADVYVAKHSMVGIMSNDKVEILVKKDGDRLRGEITSVIERGTKKVSGRVKKMNASQGALRDESFAWGEDLKISWPPQMQIKDQDWVIVNITSYPESVRGFQGQVDAVIGDISDPQTDNLRVLATQNIPYKFTAKALAEAKALPPEVHESEFAGRKDLRQKNFITIDGKTAKDFDDAIYVEKMPKGFRLWVAIADVSHYVRVGSAIDKEAYDRGTSTYFPNFVSPMLPEALSNELCSLKPNVPRLALVAQMDMSFEGEKQSAIMYEAVIQSQARVTYGEAQEIIDGGVIPKLQHVKDNIKLASELSHILMTKRFRDGSLNLELPESTIELDESGVPVDIIRSDRIFAHRLIEELMLAANVAVAEFLNSKGVPAVFRIHEPPKLESLQILERFLGAFGYQKKLGTSQLQKRITQALEEFRGEASESVLNMLALRSMNQAKYSPHNVGHFGLGFDNYAHFTSPIRRYPDLIIHRLVKAALGIKGYARMGIAQLEDAGTMLSACEQRSVKGERLINSIKKARFLEKHLGEEFDGIITSVAKFGVFVTLRKFDVDGLVRVEELGGEHYEFDEENLRLVGRRSRSAYNLGDPIRIQVAAADHQMGRVDFVLAKEESTIQKKTTGLPQPKHANKGAAPAHKHASAHQNHKQSRQSEQRPVKGLGHAFKKKDESDKERRSTQDDRDNIRKIRVSGHYRKDESQVSHGSRKTHPRKHK